MVDSVEKISGYRDSGKGFMVSADIYSFKINKLGSSLEPSLFILDGGTGKVL